MPINDNVFKVFTVLEINSKAPDAHGVYALFTETKGVIYYGRALGKGVTIKSRLLNHINGDEGPCTENAAYFKVEVCTSPATREDELVSAFEKAHGHRPRCNERPT